MHTLPSASTPLLPPLRPSSYPLPQWPLAHVTGSPPPSETPIVPTQPKCPQMLMTCCHSAYKQNDMIYCNYRFHQLRNENVGAGTQSTVGEGLAQLPTDSRSWLTSAHCIFFLMASFFFTMFFFSCFVQWPSNLPQANVPCCTPPPTPPLLLAVSTCLFYLAADSL